MCRGKGLQGKGSIGRTTQTPQWFATRRGDERGSPEVGKASM